jgi:tight adherence protein B
MRRLGVTAILLGVLSLMAAPAALAQEQLHISPLSGSTFPKRSFALTLPKEASLSPSQVRVRENGGRVSHLSLQPASAANGKKFGVVLVMDASDSMRGRPIRDAFAAARAFAANRNPQQSLAVVTFNRKAVVALPFTTDQSEIDSALASPPPLASGTHIYDAVSVALSLIKKAGITGGSIVLLSDGADTKSVLSRGEVAGAARDGGVRIFAVGLRSNAFRRHALQALAAMGQGEYAEARSPKDLTPIYTAFGSRLANAYQVEYRSLAPLDSNVHVDVTINGLSGSAAADYLTPSARSKDTVSKDSGFFRSKLGALAVSLGCALLIGIAAFGVLAVGPRRRSVRERLEDFVSMPEPEAEKNWSGAFTKRVLVEAEKSLEHASWWAGFKVGLDVGRIKMPATKIVVLTALGTLLLMVLLVAASGSVVIGLLAFSMPLLVRAIIRRRVQKQRDLFAEQLADNLQVIASAMRAGHSFAGAFAVAAQDAPEPARSEFQRVIGDEKLGVPMDEALTKVVRRMESRDLEQVVITAGLQREAGGNSAEVIDRVAETLRQKFELRRMVDTLTAQGRLSRWVVSFIPGALLGIITVMNPGYMSPLYHTSTGHLMLVVAAVLVIAGSLVIKRIVEIEV